MPNDRQSDRERRRLNKTASDVPDPFVPQRPPQRAGNACDPPAAEPTQPFFAPEGCPPPTPIPDAIPDPLIFLNDGLVLNCADIPGGPPSGPAVTIAAGTFETKVYFQNIPNVTTAQLTFIAGLDPQIIDLLYEASTDADDMRQLLNLESAQAVYFWNAREDAAALVVSRELQLATNSLSCVWLNEEVTAECAAGAFETAPEGQESRVNNPIVVPAGTYSSAVSQAEANQQATEAANAALRCLWGNTEQVADCVTDLDFGEAVPVDESPVGAASRSRVGSVTVAANTFFSDISQDDANALAKTAAVGALECFYINEDVSATCAPDAEGVAAEVQPSPSGETATSGTAGNPLLVPEGFLESAVSTADANGQALVVAQSLLLCFWLNDEQTAVCPPVTLGEEEYLPSSTSPVSSVTVLAGEVISFISKGAANEEALTRAQLGLECLYCNKEVYPKCIPPDYIPTILPIPLSEIDTSWSLSATLGAPAGLFCTPDPAEAQSVANSLGNVPVPALTPPDDCTYGNAPIVARCIGDPAEDVIVVGPLVNPVLRGGPCVGGASGTAPGGYILPEFLPAGDVIEVALFEPAVGVDLSSLSYPNPFAADPNKQKLTIARNTITVQEEFVPAGYAPGNPNRAKLYANELAATVALSSLNCFFTNCAGRYRCHDKLGASLYNPPFIGYDTDGVALYGSGDMTSTIDNMAYPVSSGSDGHPSKPVFVAEGQFTSFTSQLEVDTALKTYLLGALNCFWSNSAISIQCGSVLETAPNGYGFTFTPGAGEVNGDPVHPLSRGHPSDPVAVAANLFPSDLHPNLPLIQAYQLAIGQLDCFFLNVERTAECPAAGTASPGSVHLVTVLADQYFSKFSQLNADQQANLLAVSSLFCLYDSAAVNSQGCGEGQISLGAAALDPGAVTSPVSTDAATAVAQQIVNGQESCVDPDDIGGGQGAPGNDGAQTGCSGNCYGYYS